MFSSIRDVSCEIGNVEPREGYLDLCCLQIQKGGITFDQVALLGPWLFWVSLP